MTSTATFAMFQATLINMTHTDSVDRTKEAGGKNLEQNQGEYCSK